MVSPLLQMIAQGLPVVESVAQLESVDGLSLDLPLGKVAARRLALGGIQEQVVKVLGGRLVDLSQPLLELILGSIGLSSRFQAHSRSPGQEAQRSGEILVLLLHDEGEDIAPCATGPEAMPALGIGEDDEGGRLLGVEGTDALVVPPRLFQGDVTGDHFDYIQPLLDLVNHAHTDDPSTTSPLLMLYNYEL